MRYRAMAPGWPTTRWIFGSSPTNSKATPSPRWLNILAGRPTCCFAWSETAISISSAPQQRPILDRNRRLLACRRLAPPGRLPLSPRPICASVVEAKGDHLVHALLAHVPERHRRAGRAIQHSGVVEAVGPRVLSMRLQVRARGTAGGRWAAMSRPGLD